MSASETPIGAGAQRDEIKTAVVSDEITGTAEIDDDLIDDGMTVDDNDMTGPSTSDMFCSPER